ncbi:N-acetylmuramoyl-L-alanine amidase [Lachnospiraceae bacterium 54-11]
MLKNTTVSAVLVEIGYLSNYNERNQPMSKEYQEKPAGELVKGIVKGLEEKTG